MFINTDLRNWNLLHCLQAFTFHFKINLHCFQNFNFVFFSSYSQLITFGKTSQQYETENKFCFQKRHYVVLFWLNYYVTTQTQLFFYKSNVFEISGNMFRPERTSSGENCTHCLPLMLWCSFRSKHQHVAKNSKNKHCFYNKNTCFDLSYNN